MAYFCSHAAHSHLGKLTDSVEIHNVFFLLPRDEGQSRYTCIHSYIVIPKYLNQPRRPPIGKWMHKMGFPGGSEDKASACNAGDLGSIPGLGRSPGEGNGKPLQYSCLENPMDRGAWWAIVHQGSQRVGHDWATSHTYSPLMEHYRVMKESTLRLNKSLWINLRNTTVNEQIGCWVFHTVCRVLWMFKKSKHK